MGKDRNILHIRIAISHIEMNANLEFLPTAMTPDLILIVMSAILDIKTIVILDTKIIAILGIETRKIIEEGRTKKTLANLFLRTQDTCSNHLIQRVVTLAYSLNKTTDSHPSKMTAILKQLIHPEMKHQKSSLLIQLLLMPCQTTPTSKAISQPASQIITQLLLTKVTQIHYLRRMIFLDERENPDQRRDNNHNVPVMQGTPGQNMSSNENTVGPKRDFEEQKSILSNLSSIQADNRQGID